MVAHIPSKLGDFPLTVPVGVERRRIGALDEYGSPTMSFEPVEMLKAFAVAKGGEEPTTTTNPERVAADLTVYLPTSDGVGALDRIEFEGAVFEVEGVPGDWDANPWWTPGLAQIRCRKITG